MLGAVDGGVGVGDHGLRVLAGPRRGDAEAGGHGELVPADADRVLERVQQPSRVGLPLGRADQREELVAAEAGERRRRRGVVAQPLGDLDQQRVADGVAEAVVDALEVVEVDEHDRDRLAGRGQHRLQALAEQRAVGQPGQRIVPGVVAQRGLGPPQPAGQDGVRACPRRAA